jgi:carbamate kinase
MRIVIALGGNALLRRGDPMTTEVQRQNVKIAAEAIAPLAAGNVIDGVYLDWGSPDQRRLGRVTPEELAGYEFAAGSMGPKVEAAARFVAKTGGRAAIGSLADIAGIVAGSAGTNVIKHDAPAEAGLGSLAT